MYTTENYHHIDIRDSDDFITIRTPEWSRHAATVIAERELGFELSRPVEVRTGKLHNGRWAIHSILIPNEKDITLKQAIDLAHKIDKEIEHK